MRISIRVQLGSLLLLSSLIGLAVISIAVWTTVHDFVLQLRATRLALTASLKAAQLDSNLEIMQTTAGFVASRVIVQYALQRYNQDYNNSLANWSYTALDLQAAVGGDGSLGQTLLLQSRLYPKNASGPAGPYALVNTTASNARGSIPLPYAFPNGTTINLGDNTTWGFPPPLYPNLTYFTGQINGFEVAQASWNGRVLSSSQPLLLGPFVVNSTFALVSLSTPIVNATDSNDVLGFLTTVINASLISAVIESPEGLGDTGETLILGPAAGTNKFPSNIMKDANMMQNSRFEVRYILPLNDTSAGRHPKHVKSSDNAPFNASDYPIIYNAIAAAEINSSDSSGANVKAKNEAGKPVSVGYAKAQSSIVDWIVLVEQDREEIWQPINRLRDVIVACVFATAAFMAIISYPLAHFASLPILRLRAATRKSIEPPGTANSRSSLGSFPEEPVDEEEEEGDVIMARKEGVRNPVKRWKRKREETTHARREERRRREFRIPGKVKERKHGIKDELSDLTKTFNEMSDELMMQYSKLEERVQQRTAELELSKKAAEAANESKTLFIANISHELKTPLNGILGMCAVCMQEDDPIRLKRSLGIIYKSGDLLLNLLTDLLTFSKNQVGQSLSLDEKEFRLRDVSTQILAIFDKQAKEGNIDLRVDFEGIHDDGASPERRANGPAGTGKMRDMILWGDIHRILQVVINLVSNSLKFTPGGGSVVLTIRCLSEVPEDMSRRTSTNSKQSRQRSSRHRSSDGALSVAKMSTANAINVKDKPHALVVTHERTVSPPVGRYVYFEFEVADTGPGIPENLLGKIFEPFVQGDLGLSKKYGGTGLGLSICSQLTSLMRGGMSVRSTVGAGSFFTMKIPLRHLQSRADSSASSAIDRTDCASRHSSIDEADGARAHGPVEFQEGPDSPSDSRPPPNVTVNGNPGNDSQPRLVGLSQPFFAASQPLESPRSQPAAMRQIADEAARGGKLRVLVAEDNKVNQEVVLRMLKLEDVYDVTVAKDGQEALDLVKESMRGENCQPFNLIFMDVQMPNVDGLQSTRLIREIGYDAPIVALTAFAEESNIKDCYESGMNYFLSKPIRRPQLKKVLTQYCAPIPEEENENLAPRDGRRSSGVSTTIVVVNGQTGTAGSSSVLTDRPATSALARPTADQSRPVSPRSVP